MNRTPWLDAFEAACDELAKREAPVGDWLSVGKRFLKTYQEKNEQLDYLRIATPNNVKVALVKVLGTTQRGKDHGWRFSVERVEREYVRGGVLHNEGWYTCVRLVRYFDYPARSTALDYTYHGYEKKWEWQEPRTNEKG